MCTKQERRATESEGDTRIGCMWHQTFETLTSNKNVTTAQDVGKAVSHTSLTAPYLFDNKSSNMQPNAYSVQNIVLLVW